MTTVPDPSAIKPIFSTVAEASAATVPAAGAAGDRAALADGGAIGRRGPPLLAYDADAAEYLLESHYRRCERPMRRCHPRDLMLQMESYCAFHDLPLEMHREYFDVVVRDYFTVMESSREGEDERR